MNILNEFVASPLAARLGWVFLHFLWQGALIAGALWLVNTALGKPRAQARYLASCVALVLMLIAPVATLLLMSQPALDAGSTVSLTTLIAALERGTSSASPGSWR